MWRWAKAWRVSSATGCVVVGVRRTIKKIERSAPGTKYTSKTSAQMWVVTVIIVPHSTRLALALIWPSLHKTAIMRDLKRQKLDHNPPIKNEKPSH